MKIYKAERDAGLEEILTSSAGSSISYTLEIQIPKTKEELVLNEKFAKSIANKVNQRDLFYLSSILVSVGWNNNDDVFLKDNVWAARKTPEDKPFNLEHIPNKIIGHITGTVGIDENGNIIPDDSTIDDLPDRFHLLNHEVIYRQINSEFEDEIAKLIAEIEDNQWRVSMECLFSGFHYAAIDNDGIERVIARNSETAFLTKHLKAYGGTGYYKNVKLGRALSNIIFSGKGLTKKPANPQSIILTNPFSAFANKEITFSTAANTKGKTMSETNTVEKQQLDSALAQIKDMQDQLKKLDAEKVQAKYDKYESTIASQKNQIEINEKRVKELEDELNSIGQQKTKADELLKSMEDELNKAKASVQEKQKELDEIAAKAKITERISALVDKGVDKAVAEKLAEKFSTVNDEQFSEIVELQASLVEKGKASTDDKLEEEKDKNTAKADDASKKLDDTKASEEPAQNLDAGDADDADKDVEELSKSLASLCEQYSFN